ncbi:MAG: hypothetical protein WCH65_04295 [bacterium]
MGEITLIGVFTLQELKTNPTEAIDFFEKNYFLIIKFDNGDDFSNEKIKLMEKQCGYSYIGIVLQKERLGRENFKKIYHRSTLYIDQKMIPNKEICGLFLQQEISKSLCCENTTIKGIKDLQLREVL